MGLADLFKTEKASCIFIKEDKLYKQTVSEKEIKASDIDKVVVNDDGTTVYLRSGKNIVSKNGLGIMLSEAGYFVRNQVALEKNDTVSAKYASNQIRDMIERTKAKAYNICSKIVKEKMGEQFDINLEVLGEDYYSLLIFRLSENGRVLESHPLYEEIDELGVDFALDEMDLSFLLSWDPMFQEGKYGVTQEMRNDSVLEEYLRGVTLHKLLEK